MLFWLFRLCYRPIQGAARLRTAYSQLRSPLYSAAIGILFVVAVAVLLEYAESAVLTIKAHEQLPRVIQAVVVWFGDIHVSLARSEELGSLLAAIATIAGAFLALYFTAYSVVVSAIYPKLPGALGGRLIGEQVGNQYVKAVVVLTGYAILLLAFRSVPGRPGVFNTAALMLLAAFGVFCFYTLGRRAFHFFDPSNLSFEILNKLYQYVNHATARGYRPFDINFQTHYQKSAASEVVALTGLISVCAADVKLRSWSLASTVWNTARFLIFYSVKKREIPSASLWYEQTPRHGNWFLADYIKLSFAVDTQGVVQPEMVPDHHWVEERVESALVEALRTTVRADESAVSLEIVQAIGAYLKWAGTNLDVGRARALLGRVRPLVLDFSNPRAEPTNDSESQHLQLAMFDAYGYAMAMVTTGLDESLEQRAFTLTVTANAVAKGQFYERNVVPALLPSLEDLREKLRLERGIEARTVTPDWYVRSRIAPRFLELARAAVLEARDLLRDMQVNEVGPLRKQKQPVRAAIHMQRGLELCRRLRKSVASLGKLASELDAAVPKKDRPWPAIDEAGIRATIDSADDAFTFGLAETLPELSGTKRPDDLPDFFGQAYETVCQSCFAALDTKNGGRFRKLFPFLFLGAMAARSRVLGDTGDWDPEVRAIMSAEPIRDLLAVSGYGLIYAELLEMPELWKTVKETWDNYLQGEAARKEAVGFVALVHRFTETGLRSGPRDMLRTNWERRLSARLREMGLVEETPSLALGTLDEAPEPKHKSKLVEHLSRYQVIPDTPAEDVFMQAYVRAQPEARDLEIEDRSGLSELFDGPDEQGQHEE